MQEIRSKSVISRLSLVQTVFYTYIHGVKHPITPVIYLFPSPTGCHGRKPPPASADNLPASTGGKYGASHLSLPQSIPIPSIINPTNRYPHGNK